MSSTKKLWYQEIWYNTLSIIVFTREGDDCWHYVAISRQTGKVASGDKSDSAKEELVKEYGMMQLDLRPRGK